MPVEPTMHRSSLVPLPIPRSKYEQIKTVCGEMAGVRYDHTLRIICKTSHIPDLIEKLEITILSVR